MYLVRQGVKGGCLLMKGHYPITAHVPTLDFVTRCHENSKDPHSVIEPLKIFASCSVELHH